nr:hypothetical protein [Bacillus sp. SM2101]
MIEWVLVPMTVTVFPFRVTTYANLPFEVIATFDQYSCYNGMCFSIDDCYRISTGTTVRNIRKFYERCDRYIGKPLTVTLAISLCVFTSITETLPVEVSLTT